MNINSGVYIVLAFFVAFLLTFSATPFIVSMSHKIGAFDMPDNKRKIHKKPIPRIGGLAIFYGFFVSTICFSILDKDLISILLGGALIMCLGVSDDIKPIKARYKLLVQILAACIPIFFGVKISHLSIPSLFSKDKFIVLNSFFSNFITLFWIVGITNAINLIDGLDGLAVGISSIASTSMLALTFLLSEFNTAILTAAVAGAGFGFLPFNFNPAKILMGDCGSTFLGFLLACTSIEGFLKQKQ